MTETMTLTTGRARPEPRRRRPVVRVAQPVVAILVAVALLGIPFLLTVLTASKTQAEAFVPTLALPTEWHLFDNFATVIGDGRMIAAFGGSVLVMVPAVLGVLILGSMAAWILGRRKSRGLAFVYMLALASPDRWALSSPRVSISASVA